VYLLAPRDTATRITLFAAALAACGPGRDTVLSEFASAEHWGLIAPVTGDIDVTVVGRNPGTRRTGIRVHRVEFLDPRDVRVRNGLRVTAPARVALELARHLDRARLEELLARARVECSIRERELGAVLDRYPAYRGAAILRAALARHGGPSFTRSEAEQRLVDLIRKAELPLPATNCRVGRHEVDFVWRAEGLAVEVDGYAFHQDRASFERDRRRDAALLADGFRVMRFTWRQLVEERFTVVARIAQVLGSTAK
jgi:very-short-patch-repair endonuclease